MSAKVHMAGAPMRLVLSCTIGFPNPLADCCSLVTPAETLVSMLPTGRKIDAVADRPKRSNILEYPAIAIFASNEALGRITWDGSRGLAFPDMFSYQKFTTFVPTNPCQ